MRDVKPTIAKNLAYFRREAGLTQAQLAEKLNYSDKAVSRWENGDTLPDINVLYHLCEFYGIDMDTLAREDADTVAAETAAAKRDIHSSFVYRLCLYGLSVAAVWLVATTVFLYADMSEDGGHYWMAFIWAMPASCLALRLIEKLFARREMVNHTFRFCANTVFVWTAITAVFLQVLVRPGGHILWPLFLVGIPVECILILWFRLKRLQK